MVAGTLQTSMVAITAERLVEEAQAFSQGAWAQIFDQSYPRIYDYCYLRTGDRAVAEDLASEVFLQALRSIGRYRYRGIPLVAWLYRIARNVTADHLHLRASRPTVPLANESRHPSLTSPDGADAADNVHDVRSAIRRLTDDQQQVIILRFFHDLSHEETAEALGKRPGAVRVLQSRALAALRRQMQPEGSGS